MDLEFYVIGKGNLFFKGNLKQCIFKFRELFPTNKDYLALGVQNDMSACDLLITTTSKGLFISNDYKCMEFTKNNALIHTNTINILKREFDV